MELALYILSRMTIFQRAFISLNGAFFPSGTMYSCWILICSMDGEWTLLSFSYHFLHFSATLRLDVSCLSLSPTPLLIFLQDPSPRRSDEVIPNKPSECASSAASLLSNEVAVSVPRCLFLLGVCPLADVVYQSLQRPIVRHFKKNVVILTASASAGSLWRNSWMKLDNFH